MNLLRFLALALTALLLQPDTARAASNAEMAIAWSEMPQTCAGIASFKARFGSNTAYAGRLATLSTKLGCVKKPVVKRDPPKPKPPEQPARIVQKPRPIAKPAPLPAPPPRQPSQLDLGTAALARGDIDAATGFFYQSCYRDNNAYACNQAGRVYEKAKVYSTARTYDERSCQISSKFDTNRQVYCSNASVVYRNSVYGVPDPRKSADYFLQSGTAASQLWPTCRDRPGECQTLLTGLTDPSQKNFAPARELAEWLCNNAANAGTAAQACNVGADLLSRAQYAPLPTGNLGKATSLARRGCLDLSSYAAAACETGYLIAGSDKFGLQDVGLARRFFERSAHLPSRLNCKSDMSVCYSLGQAYSTTYGYGTTNYPRAVEFFTNACNAGDGKSCLQLVSIYSTPSTRMVNARSAQEARAKANALGCYSFSNCPRSGSR